MIRLTLRVKFRAFGMDLLKVEREFGWALGVQLPPAEKVFMDERGVYLAASTR